METDNREGVALTDDADSSSMELSIIETSTNVQDETVNYQTADEENSSKYFSMIAGDSTLEASRDDNVLSSSVKSCLDATFTSPPTDKSIQGAGQSSKTENLLNSLSHISIEAVNKLHIHERIDAANILSGGVDIFDDCDNSVDEHDLVIDDDPRPEKFEDCHEIVPSASIDIDSKPDKENKGDAGPKVELSKELQADASNVIDDKLDPSTETALIERDDAEKVKETVTKHAVEEVDEPEVKPVTYSDLLQGNLPEGSSEVVLLIDEKNVEAVHIGAGVYIYKKHDGELAAMQVILSEDDPPNIKPLHVVKNDDGNLEVYEVQTKQVAVTNEELESLKTNELAENAEKIHPAENIADTSSNNKVICDAVSKNQPSIDGDGASVLIKTSLTLNVVTDSVQSVESTAGETISKESQDAVLIEKDFINNLNDSKIKVMEKREQVEDASESPSVVLGDTIEIKNSLEIVIQTSESICNTNVDESGTVNLPVNEKYLDSSEVIATSPVVVENSKESNEDKSPVDESHLTEKSQPMKDLTVKPDQSEPALGVFTSDRVPLLNQAVVADSDISSKTENVTLSADTSNISEYKKSSIKDDENSKDLPIQKTIEVSGAKQISDDVQIQTELKVDVNSSRSKCCNVLSAEDEVKIISSDAYLNKIELKNDKATQESDKLPRVHPVDDVIQKTQPIEKSVEDRLILIEQIVILDSPKNIIPDEPDKLSSVEVSPRVSESSEKDIADSEKTPIVDSQNMSGTENVFSKVPGMSEDTYETAAPQMRSDVVENSNTDKSDQQFLSSDSKFHQKRKLTLIDTEFNALTKKDIISPATLISSADISQNDVEDPSFDDSKSKMESQSSMESDDDPDDDDFVRGEPVTGDSDIAWVNSVDDSTCEEELSNVEKQEPEENIIVSLSSDRSEITVNADIEVLKLYESKKVLKTDEPKQMVSLDHAKISNITEVLHIPEPIRSQKIETTQLKNIEKTLSPDNSAPSIGESQEIVVLPDKSALSIGESHEIVILPDESAPSISESQEIVVHDVKVSKDIDKLSRGRSELLKDTIEIVSQSPDPPHNLTGENKGPTTCNVIKLQVPDESGNEIKSITKVETQDRLKESINRGSILPAAPSIPIKHFNPITDKEPYRPPEKKAINILENNNESLSNKCNKDLIKKVPRNDKSEVTKKTSDKSNSLPLFEDCAESFSEQNKSDEALTPIPKSPQTTHSNTSVQNLSPRISPKNNINIIADIAIPTPRIVDVPSDNAIHLYSSGAMRAGAAKTYLQHGRNPETKKTFNNDHSTPISNKYDYSMTEFGKNHSQKPKLSTYWNNQHNSNRTAHDAKLPQHPKSFPVKTYSSSQKLTNKILPIPEKKKEPVTLSLKDELDSFLSTNRPLNQAAAFSNTKQIMPSYNSPSKSSGAHISPKEDFTENVIGIQQYIGTASDANVDSDVIIYSAEDTASSADESINSEQTKKSKSRQPRKQVFTPVTRSDMEIIFPNLYTAEKEASKQPKSARLPYKPRGRGCNAETPKGLKKEPAKDKEVFKDSHILKEDNIVIDITSSIDKNIAKDNPKESDTPHNSNIIKDSNPARSPISAIRAQENDTGKNKSQDQLLINKRTSDISDLNDSCLAKENLTQNICKMKDAQTPENKDSMNSPDSERRDDPAVCPLSSSAKRKRGRPKKITSDTIVTQTPTAETVSPNTSSKSETEHAIVDLKSEDLSDNTSPRINSLSPFGKINENIVCPICFKTFRTENVLLKHVKHCNGAIDKEALKSPKRRKIAFETSTETDEGSETTFVSVSQSPNEQVTVSSASEELRIEQPRCLEESKIELKKEKKSSIDILVTESIQLYDMKSKSPILPQLRKTDDIPVKHEKKSIERLVEEVASIKKPTEINTSEIIIIDDSFSVATEPPIATPPVEVFIERKEILVDEPLAEKKLVNPESSCLPLEGNIKTKADSKSYDNVQSREKSDPENDCVQEIGQNFLSKPTREKMVGGGRKVNELRSAASTLSPMSRLSKILKTKPPINNSISCEICGKTFRQLAHMVYHRDKHNADDAGPSVEKSKIPIGVPKMKVSVEPEVTAEPDAMLKCEICQKGFRKLHHLVEHRETHGGEVKSRRTSAASVKSEPEAGFRCDACDKSFRKLHHLVEHRELHAAELNESASKLAAETKANDDATCAGCGKSFRKRHHMVEHRDIHCSPTKKGRSDDAEPSEENDVRLSVGSSASDDSNSCKICGKSYRKLHHMVEHRESHQETPSRREAKATPETDFMNTKDIIHECAKCYMVFPNENSLNKHASICLRKRIISRVKSMQPDIPEEVPPADANGRVLSRSKSLISHSNESVKVVVSDEPTISLIVPPQTAESSPVEETKKPTVKNKILKPSPLPKKQPKRESEPKINKEDSTVKYKINEELEIKYKINPAFVKPGKRLSQSSDTAKSPAVKPKIKRLSEVPPAKPNKRLSQPIETKPPITKAKTRRISESALSGLKIPSSKMLKTIYEECSIRYSFPPKSPKVKDKAAGIDKSTKESEKKTNNTKRIVPPPKKPAKQNTKIVTKTIPSNKKTATLVVTKRKSIGGRKSIDGKKLPTGVKKIQLKCCKQIFTSQATLAEHRKTHKARQTHKCDCGRSFEAEMLLKRHIDTEHTPPKSFKCTECGTSVRTASQFLKHKKEHEASQKVTVQRKSAGKVSNPPKKAVATAKEAVAKAKSPELGAKKAVKRKLAHGGVPLSDKMKKAMAGGKF